LLDVLVALEDVHRTYSTSNPWMRGSTPRGSIALSGIIQDQDLIPWDVLDPLHFNIFLELHNGLRIV
jgi:hypothetical protein